MSFVKSIFDWFIDDTGETFLKNSTKVELDHRSLGKVKEIESHSIYCLVILDRPLIELTDIVVSFQVSCKDVSP